MRAESLLVCNLEDSEYVNLVLDGSIANLPSEMAKHWHLAQEIRKQRQAPTTDHPLPTTKKQIRDPKLLDNIKEIVTKLIKAILGNTHAA